MGTRCGSACARRSGGGDRGLGPRAGGRETRIPAGAAPATAPATVRATPATGLADLQRVTVTGTGLTPGDRVTVRQECGSDCPTTLAGPVTVGADGRLGRDRHGAPLPRRSTGWGSQLPSRLPRTTCGAPSSSRTRTTPTRGSPRSPRRPSTSRARCRRPPPRRSTRRSPCLRPSSPRCTAAASLPAARCTSPSAPRGGRRTVRKASVGCTTSRITPPPTAPGTSRSQCRSVAIPRSGTAPTRRRRARSGSGTGCAR